MMIYSLIKTKLPESRKFCFVKIRKSSEFRIGVQWAQQGSNLRPSGYEPPALTAELWARSTFMIINDI